MTEPAYHGLRFHETFGPMAYTFHSIAVGMRDLGMTMAPQNAFLTLLGTETLSLRMKKHVENAVAVATWLEKDPRVEYVTYAGLPSSPWYDRAKRLYPNGAGSLRLGNFPPADQSNCPESITQPPTTVPLPVRYLVVECTTMSAPCSIGRQR